MVQTSLVGTQVRRQARVVHQAKLLDCTTAIGHAIGTLCQICEVGGVFVHQLLTT